MPSRSKPAAGTYGGCPAAVSTAAGWYAGYLTAVLTAAGTYAGYPGPRYLLGHGYSVLTGPGTYAGCPAAVSRRLVRTQDVPAAVSIAAGFTQDALAAVLTAASMYAGCFSRSKYAGYQLQTHNWKSPLNGDITCPFWSHFLGCRLAQ